MGTRMAQRLIHAGHTVHVWNRSADAIERIVKQGAVATTTPAEAVANADFVISMARDDEASKRIWLDENDGALHAMPEQAIAIECSTLSAKWACELNATASKLSKKMASAPLAGSRPQAEAGQLIFFVGANNEEFDLLSPILMCMGGAVHHCESHEAAATIKLAVNALLGIQLAGIAELMGVIKNNELDLEQALTIISTTPVCSPALKMASQAMLNHNFAAMLPINLVAKDFSYLQQSFDSHASANPISKATLGVLHDAIGKGFGEDNITGLAQLY